MNLIYQKPLAWTPHRQAHNTDKQTWRLKFKLYTIWTQCRHWPAVKKIGSLSLSGAHSSPGWILAGSQDPTSVCLMCESPTASKAEGQDGKGGGSRTLARGAALFLDLEYVGDRRIHSCKAIFPNSLIF